MFMCVCWISISDITDITNTQHTDGVRTDEETQNNYKEKHNVQNDHNETQNKREATKKIDVQKKTTKDQKELKQEKTTTIHNHKETDEGYKDKSTTKTQNYFIDMHNDHKEPQRHKNFTHTKKQPRRK